MKVETAFGRILQQARKSRSLSQSELADLSDLDRTYVSLLERGLRQPSLTTIIRLADALGRPPEELVSQAMELIRAGHRRRGT